MPFFRTISLTGSLLWLTACSQVEIHPSNDFANNGRDAEAEKQPELFLETPMPYGPLFPVTGLLEGVHLNLDYLAKESVPDTYFLENLRIEKNQLQQANTRLLAWLRNPEHPPALRALQIKGDDGRGNLQYTGYYVPIMAVRQVADQQFRYPIYRKPELAEQDEWPNRQQIDFEGALSGQGLEIAYSESLIDNFFLQVQGSGIVQYENGERHLLSWGGVNGHPYRSLGKKLIEEGEIAKENMSAQAIKEWLRAHPERQQEILSHNPSYLFFAEGDDRPVGAANVPLTPMASVAVDPTVIPLGSVILGQIPRLDNEGNFVGHALRLLLAQDKGGAIKGSGHIDLYQGIGEEAEHSAGLLKHYGKAWLLLPADPFYVELGETLE